MSLLLSKLFASMSVGQACTSWHSSLTIVVQFQYDDRPEAGSLGNMV